jgi:hypothetical protein
MPKKLTDKKSKHHITTAVAVFFGLLLLLIIFVGALQITYAAKFLPNTYIGNVNVGGQSMARASLQLQEQIAKINQTGFKFSAGRETALVTPLVVSPNDPDQTYELVNWQLDENLRRIFSVSHQGPWWQRFTQLLGSLFSDSYFSMDVSVDRAAEAILRDNFGQLEKTVRPTSFSFTSTDVAVVPGEDGTKIDYESALNKLESVLAALDSQVINLEVQPDLVTVGAGQAQALLPQVKQVLINDGWQLNLSYFVSTREISYTWPLSKNQLQGWLEPKKDQTIYLGLGMEARAFLERIAAQVNRQAQDAKFEIAAGGHLAQFQNSAPGVELDIDESLRNIERGFIEGGDTSATLVVNTIAPRVETAQTNELGIAEILGVGKSNFAGSPANRIHNIRVFLG